MSSTRIQTEGGTTHGLQLWVNLPAKLRRTTPRYQGLTREQMPVVRGDGFTTRVVAGDLFGERGTAESHTPVGYAHLAIEPGRNVTAMPAEENGLAAQLCTNACVGGGT